MQWPLRCSLCHVLVLSGKKVLHLQRRRDATWRGELASIFCALRSIILMAAQDANELVFGISSGVKRERQDGFQVQMYLHFPLLRARGT